MAGLFPRIRFSTYGPSQVLVATPTATVVDGRASRLREQIRAGCPRGPGIYGMIDRAGELIYVGKAKNLRARLLSYFRPNSREPKAGRIVSRTRTIAWEALHHEFAALLRELELIRRWQPRFNVLGQPDRRRRVYCCLGRAPAPYVFLSGKPPRTARRIYGPLPASERAREAVRRLNDLFHLRDCPRQQTMIFAGQGELFPLIRAPGCLRHEIGVCSAPCAAMCTRHDYDDQVRHVRAFLEGTDVTALARLERDMLSASARLEYERAAVLRDKLTHLRWLHEHLDRLRGLARQAFVYPLLGQNEQTVWYIVHGGRVRAALPLPDSPTARKRVDDFLRRLDREAKNLVTSAEEMDGVLLVAAWFRRHEAERSRLLDFSTVRNAEPIGTNFVIAPR